MNIRKTFFISCLLLIGLAFVVNAGIAEAAPYPNKPITVIQGYKPGGGSDTLAQLTQPTLEKYIGINFINQYMPGANSAIAWTRLAKQTKGDGYTWGILNAPAMYANYIMSSEIQYSVDDIDVLANVASDPIIFVVAQDHPFKTLDDMIKACKENPGKITSAISGVGTDDFFAILLTHQAMGIKTQVVPFDGDGPSWQAAMGRKIDVSISNVGISYPQIKAGNLRALGVMTEKRIELLPDVPTMKELGYDLVVASYRGYAMPKGAPAEVKAHIIEAFKKMAADPAFIKACNDRATVIDMKYGDEYRAMLERDVKMTKELWDQVKSEYSKR
ncbi:Trap-t family transporter, periplasmic binding protein [uncultured delta proteobacterium]|uniref:Trap-t family transporter, periplasmic binding protein n=1 Tax=uncultured delta proteobacterium TaxID=34034 RepID=A0A212IYS8_9DELT|nr:Trap-t family transporter, periplasmic binding protein [uncultured delta proteobacterium]